MKVKKSSSMPSAETDMTPMIDMTFQLITFFMFIMKVTDIDTDARIKLPVSQIAKPPDGKISGHTFILQITAKSDKDKAGVLFGGDVVDLTKFSARLRAEIDKDRLLGKEPKDTTVLVRADRLADTALVQDAIKVCQKNGLVNYSLRGVVYGTNKRTTDK